ncbi:MAG: nucleotidyltransferase domain-containing protein [Desulfobacteraceae bacterium]|nr:nucleotidyltransferase domain-containing protein [Desulfobacteraceae bacterium]
MIFGLREEVIEQVRGVFSKYPQIEQAVLYGSRAKGNYRNGSDIDLTLKGRDLNLSIISQINLDLDDLLLPYTFDISASSSHRQSRSYRHIERVGLVFYEFKHPEKRNGNQECRTTDLINNSI